jgi:hypothetical protein
MDGQRTDMRKLIVAFHSFANVSKNYIPIKKNRRKYVQINQPRVLEGHKLRSGINWYGTLEQKGIKQCLVVLQI